LPFFELIGIFGANYSAMRKFITIFLISVFSSSAVFSQKKNPSSFGIISGINFSNLRLDGTGSSQWDSKWKTGLVAGGFVTINISSRFSIQPEFIYSSMGGHLISAGAGTDRYRLNYFSIPVLGKIKLCNFVSAVLGPQVDILIQAKKYTDVGYYKVTNDFKDHDFLVTGGLEYWPLKFLNLTGRYMYGLTDINPGTSLSMKNQGAQITLGIKL
jgi:hypothetical protein